MPEQSGQVEEPGDSGAFRILNAEDAQEGCSGPDPSAFTFNTQMNHVDQSLHVHQAMTLPDPDAAERLQKLYPGFMSEVMEGRRREQRARLMREKRNQEIDADLKKMRMTQVHEAVIQDKKLLSERFNSAISIMGIIGVLFAIVSIVALFKANYWSAAGMGMGMAYCFSQVVKALNASK